MRSLWWGGGLVLVEVAANQAGADPRLQIAIVALAALFVLGGLRATYDEQKHKRIRRAEKAAGDESDHREQVGGHHKTHREVAKIREMGAATLDALQGPLKVRPLESSIQVVEVLFGVAGGPTPTITLGGIATMGQHGEANLNVIGMALHLSPPLKLDSPTAGQGYDIPGGLTLVFSEPGQDDVQIANASVTWCGASYRFDRLGTSVHIVPVGDRKFRVQLQEIHDASTNDYKRIRYTFGISEE